MTLTVSDGHTEFATTIAVSVALPPLLLLRGDANALDIADAICLLSYLFGAEADPCKQTVSQCLDAADSNDDGSVDIADAIAVLSHLFASSGDLPDPFGECGIDPTIDDLDCISYEPCQNR